MLQKQTTKPTYTQAAISQAKCNTVLIPPRTYREIVIAPGALMVPRAGTKTAGTTEPIPRQTTKHKTPTRKRYSKKDIQVGHYVRKVCAIYSDRISSLQLGSPYARDLVSY